MLSAPRVQVIRDGTPREIAVAELVAGDLVRLRPGDQLVADGVVRASVSLETDESLLTGESEPVGKRACLPAGRRAQPAGHDRQAAARRTTRVPGSPFPAAGVRGAGHALFRWESLLSTRCYAGSCPMWSARGAGSPACGACWCPSATALATRQANAAICRTARVPCGSVSPNSTNPAAIGTAFVTHRRRAGGCQRVAPLVCGLQHARADGIGGDERGERNEPQPAVADQFRGDVAVGEQQAGGQAERCGAGEAPRYGDQQHRTAGAGR